MGSITHYDNGPLGSPNSHNLQTTIEDISTAGSDWTSTLPFDYEVENAFVTLYGAITGSDATITLKVGGVEIAGTSTVIPVIGSGAGVTIAMNNPSGGVTNETEEGQPIEVITDGASTGAIKAIVNLSVRRTYVEPPYPPD